MAKATPKILLKCLYLSAAALVFFPNAVFAAEEPESQSENVLEDCSVPMARSNPMPAMRVFIDPETGEIRQPTADEMKTEAGRVSIYSPLNRSTTGLRIVQKPDGAKFVRLDGRFMHAMVLTRGEDGTLTAKCISDSHDHGKSAKEAAPLR